MSFMRATNLPVTSGRWADGQSTELAPPPPTNSIGSIDVACLFTGNNILHAGSIFRFNSQCINYLCINRWLKMPKRVHNCVCSKSQYRPPQCEEEYNPQPCRTVNALNYRDGGRCHDSLIFKWTRRVKQTFKETWNLQPYNGIVNYVHARDDVLCIHVQGNTAQICCSLSNYEV